MAGVEATLTHAPDEKSSNLSNVPIRCNGHDDWRLRLL